MGQMGSMRQMRSMGMMRDAGARFRFSRGDAHVDIKCPQNESLQSCVQAAGQLLDKLHSLRSSAEAAQPSSGGGRSDH